jgi:hypothetical protein
MGNSTILDLMFSIIVAGFLFLMVIRISGGTAESTFVYGNDLTVQENLVSFVRIIETDFRLLGYCADYKKLPDPLAVIIMADSNRIKFLTDVESDGEVDTLEYFLGDSTALRSTPNPKDRPLFRTINSEPPTAYLFGIIEFSFGYRSTLGDTLATPISDPRSIHLINLTIGLESPSAYDNKYSSAYWRQLRLASRNLNNR